MPAKSRPSLTLLHAQSSPENAMLRANKHLSEGQPKEATKLYTEILYKLSPGHVCAFLNRSLAYLCLDMPELAVVDAYRAAMLANQMREDEKNGLPSYQAASKFLRAERVAVEGGEPWTSERGRFVQGNWAYSALSTIVINDIPELEDPAAVKYQRFSTNKRQVVCLALEIRAIYRLCGALYMCGGGARSDALGLIDDAHRRCTGMENWEKTYFQMLGNEILDDCMKPWDEGMNDPQGLAFMSLSEQRRRDEERRKTKESMLAKTTMLKVSEYRWNIHEPELDNADWQKLLRSWVSQTTENCSPHFVGIDDIRDETSKPYVELRANRDINAGELVLSERSRSNVTTSIPEDIFENPNPPPLRRYYCDTCSSLMIVPRDCLITYKGPTAPTLAQQSSSHHSTSPTLSRSSQDSVNAAYGSDDDNSDYTTDLKRSSRANSHSSSQPPVLPPDTPPSQHLSPTRTDPPDITFCAPSHLIPTCSSHCLTARAPYDFSLHSISIERDLRNDHLLTPPIPKELEERKTHCLRDLLLLRIFANAVSTAIHPLQDRELLFATCGAGVLRKAVERDGEGKRMWSFTSDVVRPIHYLSWLLEEQGSSQWDRLELCDAWVLMTLLSKIDTAMRVEKEPVYAKVYNLHGRVERTVYAYDIERNEVICEDVVEEDMERWKDRSPWCASVHPIFNMIRAADSAKGERPNVSVVRTEGVLCYALAAIGAGEALVRGHAVEGVGEIRRRGLRFDEQGGRSAGVELGAEAEVSGEVDVVDGVLGDEEGRDAEDDVEMDVNWDF